MKWEPKTHTLTGSIGSHNFSTDYDIRKDLKDPENTIFGITSSTAIYETSQGIFFSKLQIPTKPHGELETEKLADKNTVKPGETVTYTLVAKNIKENTTLENITIEDNLEEGLELDPTSLQLDGQVVANEATGNNIKVTIPEIEGIGESRVTFKAKVTKTTNGIIKNIAVVTDPEDPVTPIFPEVPIEVVDAPGKLAAEKLVSKKQARPGDILTYTIVARNILDDTILKNITIEDTLPVGLELVPNSVKINNQTVTNNGVGNEVKVTIPSIPGVGLSRVVFQAKVTKTDDGIITNTAIVTDPNEPTKPIKPEVPVEVISHPGILETEKLVDEAVAKPGDIVTYTIVARNILDDSILKEVLVQDELPKGLELVNDSIELDGIPIENEVAKNNHVQITIPEISGGGESQISFKVKITQEYNGEIINVALVTDPEDPENPQEPEVPLEVVDAPGKLAAEKLVNHNTVKPGDTVTYTIKAKNILDKTVLKGVLVEDEIPEGLELIEDSIELDG